MRVLVLIWFVVLGLSSAAAQSVPSWAAPSPPAPPATPTQYPGGAPPPAGPPAPPGTPTQYPATVPIDGGLGLLALAGGAYAVSKLRRRG
ncbi:PID-CTERM protein-sorting domain-containing protein [Rubrivirga marina]|uniref:Gram-positive cocci surface proteins LPxTG domain-containing protein n=1 Tax=Rubrivirga marina TaxID=1196024 RepID=A0A271J360_9BACT|nr:hypothetical protein [Rubrivirga marina]PAP77484.1 hypothetical protein BSZ37_14075 [Rubrivirga marina]